MLRLVLVQSALSSLGIDVDGSVFCGWVLSVVGGIEWDGRSGAGSVESMHGGVRLVILLVGQWRR